MNLTQTIRNWFPKKVTCRWCAQKIKEDDALLSGWKHDGDYWYCAIHK